MRKKNRKRWRKPRKRKRDSTSAEDHNLSCGEMGWGSRALTVQNSHVGHPAIEKRGSRKFLLSFKEKNSSKGWKKTCNAQI